MFGLPTGELVTLAIALVLAGALTGILAGLFGVGGGAIIVPILYQVFVIIGAPEAVRMPLAVGTSLAIIIPTSLRSFLAHRARGAVDMTVLRLWAVPCFLGVLAGSAIAAFAPPWLFKIVFVAVAGLNGIQLLVGGSRWRIAD
ncbi:MAG TPA: sulfite exporter TauE/SafE family protein, partial [Xanthobacteraceae bacterium]|nr:sulfite exporter TauE/SafE family protein [Xanthobacteraceae bacterium]